MQLSLYPYLYAQGTGQKTPKRVFATVSAEARAIVIPREVPCLSAPVFNLTQGLV